MSFVAMDWAMEADVDQPSERLVLVTLAKHMNSETGACFPSITTIARMACLSRRQVMRSLQALEARGLVVSRKKAGCPTHYELPLTSGHQCHGVTSDTVSPTPDMVSPPPVTSCHPNQEPNQEENQELKLAREVRDYLNEKLGTRYRSDTDLATIRGRIIDGATVEECKLMIDFMIAKWRDNDDMRRFLRPSTLFRASKFDGYLLDAKSLAARKDAAKVGTGARRASDRESFRQSLDRLGLEAEEKEQQMAAYDRENHA